MATIFKDGITQDSVTGQIYQVGRSPDAIDPVAPTPATTTPTDLYGAINFETPEERAFREQQGNEVRTTATTPVDEAAIRTNTLAKFQAEIDALNRFYAEKKQAERAAGEGRLGSVAAIGARRGLLGSDFGVAQENNQVTANTDAVDAIEIERAAKEQAVLSEARGYADKEIASKTEAKKLGAENYLKFIAESSERKRKNAEDIVKKLYEAGTGEKTDFKAIADSLGISVEALKKSYDEYAKNADLLKEEETKKAAKVIADEKYKKEQDLLKEGYVYVKTPKERDDLKKQGYSMIELEGRTYSKPPKTKTTTVKVGSTTYSITTDEMGKELNRTVIGSGGSGTKPPVPKKTTPEKEVMAEVLSIIPDAVGSDGFISPMEHQNLRNQWIQQGYNPATFDTGVKGYLNPNNPSYVTKKQ